MKFSGVDYGTRHVGIAVSNTEGTIAFPRATFANGGRLVPDLVEFMRKENVEHIVVGDTRTHGGAENPITAAAEHFMEELAQATGLPVSRVFEVFSSVEASRYAPKGSEHDDAAAAAIILQRFLDMRAAR